VRVRHGRASLEALVLEDQDILEAVIAAQVLHALAIGAQDVPDLVFAQVCQLQAVFGRLDDDLVRADAAHHVEDADSLPHQLALDAEHRVLVGQHAHPPARRVTRGAVPANGEDLGGVQGLLAAAEDTRRRLAAARNGRHLVRS